MGARKNDSCICIHCTGVCCADLLGNGTALTDSNTQANNSMPVTVDFILELGEGEKELQCSDDIIKTIITLFDSYEGQFDFWLVEGNKSTRTNR